MREPVMEERPVPPLARATMPVMLLAVPPMLRVDVESAVTFPAPPVAFPRMVLAEICGSWVRVSALVPMPMETFAPPIWYPRVPLVTERPLPTESVVVATFAKVLAPLKYGMLPTTAAVVVERPPKVRLGVVPPLEMMGQVPVTEVTAEEVATHAMPPVAFDHPRTIPPVLAP